MQTRRTAQTSREAWVLEEIARHDPAMVLQGLRALTSFDSLPWLGDVDLPVAVVRTLQDVTVPTADQDVMIDALADRSVFDVDAPHRAAVEAAELFVPALMEALADVEDRALTSAQPVKARRTVSPRAGAGRRARTPTPRR